MSVSPSAEIHPLAVISEGAVIGAGCRVGPFCVVGPEVELGEGCRLESHVVVAGWTRIGPRAHMFPFASIGHKPQDLKYKGERTRLIVGSDCQIREGVTMNPGTEGGGGLTQVGNGCLFMANAHVAHDCRIGDNVIFANGATCAGHVTVGDHAILGGLSAVHQFVRIGAQAMIGGMAGVERDVIPFGVAIGNRAELAGLNMVGLKRRGFGRDEIQALRGAYKAIFEEEAGGSLPERAAAAAAAYPGVAPVAELAGFIQAETDRRFCTPRA